MRTLFEITSRNIRLFFKDKAMFFTSLITPAILLVLYGTFLGNVYKDSFVMSLPQGFEISESIIDSFVGGQLVSSILAVSCVTVAFCSNMLMVQDKANGSLYDLVISPVKSSVLASAYYLGTFFSTLIIALSATGICFIYLAFVGWYMSFADVMLLFLDVALLVMFGTALSSIINFFLSTQGQISAVGTIISSGYGFICGAYMPISQFAEGLRKVILFLPGTYGTSLLRNHAMNGVFKKMTATGIPADVMDAIRDSIDCNLYFYDHKVSIPAMYAILTGTTTILLLIYILMNFKRKMRKK